jgi:hypothetical protein
MSESLAITGPDGLVPYSPAWLNSLSEADRQSIPVRNFSRSLHDDGCAHVAWLLWSVQEKDRATVLEYRQGSMFLRGAIRRTTSALPRQIARQGRTPKPASAAPSHHSNAPIDTESQAFLSKKVAHL